VAGRAGDGSIGFNVLIGGGLSDGERMASDIDVFIRPDQAVELCRGVAQLFGELGNRENRGLARMRYLAQELGPEGFRAALDERTKFTLDPAGRELTDRFRGDHVGVHPQKQPGCLRRLLGPGRPDARDRSDRDGPAGRDLRRRRRADRHRPELHPLRHPRGAARRPAGRAAHAKYSPFPGPFERGVVACTGSEFCRFAVVETKERAVKWARTLDAQLSGDGADGRRAATPA
jgi:ferredoxin-nitrite reductase